jgi:hypothetical protein
MKLNSVWPASMRIKAPKTSGGKKVPHLDNDNNNNNNNNFYYYYLLQLGCHPVAVVMLRVYKT